jgi:hypothetical protein
MKGTSLAHAHAQAEDLRQSGGPYKATMYNRKIALQKLEYMHNNPINVALCARPEDYLFSSYR